MSNTAVLDENGIATVAGDITVYHYDEETREYTSSSVEYLALGVGTPAHSCADAPPEAISGYVVCRTATLNGWEHVPDHRGETVYSTENGNPVLITQPGDYPADTTTKQPATPWQRRTVDDIDEKDHQYAQVDVIQPPCQSSQRPETDISLKRWREL